MSNKLSLDDAIRIAKSLEGKCLSEEYINSKTLMLWECNKKHQWTAQFNSIKHHHTWCPYCAKKKKLDISVSQELAHAKNGKCISEKYINLSYGNAQININFTSLLRMLKIKNVGV